MALTTAQHVSMYNEALEAFSLSLTPVKKFSTLADAQRRVAALCAKHGLRIQERDGQAPILVKETAVKTDDNFEMTDTERNAQTRPVRDAETIGDTGAIDTTVVAGSTTDTHVVAGSTDTVSAQPGSLAQHVETNKARAVRTPKVERAPRKASEIHACRAGTNQALLVDMLFAGDTVENMTNRINAVQGKKLSPSVIYSTILYDVCTVKGYGVTSKLVDDKAHFKLVLPAGMDKPLAHTERKTAKPSA